MEKLATLLFPVLLISVFLHTLIYPLRVLFRFVWSAVSGLLCLWILNTVSEFTGVLFPINTVTVALAGFAGLPGICLIALLGLI